MKAISVGHDDSATFSQVVLYAFDQLCVDVISPGYPTSFQHDDILTPRGSPGVAPHNLLVVITWYRYNVGQD